MTSLRDQIIIALVNAKGSLRFTELYEATGISSRSHFGTALSKLVSENLVIRNEIDYKNVEYTINTPVYQKYLLAEQVKLNEKLKQAGM